MEREACVYDHGFERLDLCAEIIIIIIITLTGILITMHSHQSYPNITTVTHSYEYSPTIDNSTITTYTNRGLGN